MEICQTRVIPHLTTVDALWFISARPFYIGKIPPSVANCNLQLSLLQLISQKDQLIGFHRQSFNFVI